MKNFITLITLFFSVNAAMATHIVGADISYVCLNSNTYEVTLKVYQDCGSIPFADGYTLSANATNCSLSTTFTVDSVAGSLSEITQNCTYASNTCNGGSIMGINYMEYKGVVVLDSCDNWVLEWSTCCRNQSTSNVSNLSTAELTVQAELNNQDAPCNNSPRFMQEPLFFACFNSNTFYDQSAGEPDGDSIVYEFYHPMTGQYPSNGNVSYNSPYTYLDFISSGTPITLDNATGELNLELDLVEGSIMGVVVKEYRSGVFIGSVSRDNIILPGDVTSGIQNNDNISVNIYPNPNSGKFNIELPEDSQRIIITDVTGSIVSENYIQKGLRLIEMDLQEAGAGIYIVSVHTSKGKSSQLLVVN